MNDVQNNFGPLVESYTRARRGYPKEVYMYLKSLVNSTSINTLDVGCGTGISSRELSEIGFSVTGLDKDADMLNAARSESADITYVEGEVEKLPFSDRSFGLITAFTAFHWFNEKVALSEIYRVLKPGGIFFAALKGNQESGGAEVFNNAYRTILRKYAGAQFDTTLRHFDLELLMKQFGEVITWSFPYEESYSIDDSLTLLTSLSLWNRVSESDREAFMSEMRSFFESVSRDGLVIRKRLVHTLHVQVESF